MNKFTTYLLTTSLLFSFISSFSQFEENKGQIYDEGGTFREDVMFVTQVSSGNIFFTDHGIVHHFRKITPAKFDEIRAGKIPNPYSDEEWEAFIKQSAEGSFVHDGFKEKGEQYRIDMTFPGADLSNAVGETEQLQKNQYFLPQLEEGISGVKIFEKVRYHNAYPGVDIIFYFVDGRLKYDFEVEANADIERIKILYVGHQDISIDESGNVVVKILPGEIRELAPISFQNGKEIASSFKLDNDTISFQLGDYDRKQALLIDPALTWSTYFHDGTTSALFTSTRPVWDGAGNMYQALDTYNRTTYPLVNPGGSGYYNISPGSTGLQLVIQKYNSSRQIVWATYYPASQSSRTNFSNGGIVIDNNDNLYVTGSMSFVYANPIPAFSLLDAGGGAYYETTLGTGRNFILKFDSNGQRLWATMFSTTATGSSSGLDFAGLSIGSNNKLYAVGETYTPASGSWNVIPLANPGGSHYYRPSPPESETPFLHRFSATGVLEWGTYISQGIASSFNAGQAIALDASDNIFIGGRAGQVFGSGSSTPYTLVNPGGGAYQDGFNTNSNNGRKMSLFKFGSNGALVWNSLYGGTTSANSVIWQDIRDVTVASNGDVFFAGRANTTNLPTLNPGGGAYMKTTLSTGSTSVYDGVVLQFSNTGVRKWATYCGGNGSSDGTDFWGIAKDASGNITLAGVSRTTNTFPVQSNAGSYNQATQTGAYATVLIQFNSLGVRQWGTYYGSDSWMSSGGFGGDGTGKYVMFGASESIPFVNPGGGAIFENTHELTATRSDFIAEFGGCSTESNTTTTTAICENATKPLTSSGSGGGTWSIVSGGGSITGTGPYTYNPVNVSATTTVTVRYVDGCGNGSNISFSVNPLPATPGAISGTTTPCTGVGQSYTIAAVPGATSYTWAYSGGGTPSGTGTTGSLTPTSSGTLTVTATNSCGTSSSSSLAITVGNAPSTPGTISGTTTPCTGVGQSYTITAVPGATSYTWAYSGGGTPSGTGTTGSLTPASSGTLTVTATNSCGTSSAASLPITVSSTPSTPGAISGTSTPCSGVGQNYTIAAVPGATSYTWAYSGGGTPTGTGTTGSLTPTSSGTLTVTATNSCGTSSSASLPLTVGNAPATPGAISGTTTPCSGVGQNYTITAVPGATSYTWAYSGGGTPSGTGTTGSLTPTSSGTLTVTAANACGTSSSTSLAITVGNAPATPGAISGTATPCSGVGQSYTITAVPGATSYTWAYSGGGTPSGTGTTGSLTPTSSGTLTVTATNSCGTSSSASLAITVGNAPATPGAISGSATACSGLAETYSISAVTGATSYNWNYTGTGSISGTGTSVDLTATGSGNLEVTATNSCGTSSAQTIAVTINALDDPSFSYSGGTFCLTGSDPTPTIAGLSGGTFSIDNGGTIDAGTGVIDLDGNGLQNYTVTYLTTGTCPTSTIASVSVTSAPSATFSYTGTPYCSNGANPVVTFGAGASGGTFSSTAGLTINSSTGEIDLSTSTPNTYTVSNDIAASGGCAAANATTSVIITAADNASFSYSGSTYCLTGTDPTPTISGTTGGTFASTPAGLSLNAGTGEITLSTSSTATYDVTYTTGGTCPDNSLVSVTIDSSPTVPTTGTSATGNAICEGESADITASGSTGTGVTYAVFDALTGGTNLGVTPLTVSPTTTTTYYVESFNSNGCGNIGGRQAVTITVNPTPSLSAGNDETICPGDNVTLTAAGTGSLVWSTTETTASITVSPAATTTYTVTLTDGNTCTNTDDVIVTVVTNGGTLIAEDDAFTAETDTPINLDVLLNDTYGGNTSNIVLTPLNGTATSNIDGSIDYQSTVGFVGIDSLTYEICDVACASICDTATVIITVDKLIDFGVPGGFSPNGDNINDVFVIQGLDEYPDNSLSIFNRWGSIIYQAAPYNNDWDGSATEGVVLTGDKVTTGTYFYILELGEGVEPLRGSIEIKRD